MSERGEAGTPPSSERGPSGSGASAHGPGIPVRSERNHVIVAAPSRSAKR